MKKVILSLTFLFAVTLSTTAANFSDANFSIEIEKGKCDKCGSKKCEGSCESKKETSTSETKAPAKGCCSQGASKSCDSKKKK